MFMFLFINENTPHNACSSTHSTRVNRLVPFLFPCSFLAVDPSFLPCNLSLSILFSLTLFPLPILTVQSHQKLNKLYILQKVAEVDQTVMTTESVPTR